MGSVERLIPRPTTKIARDLSSQELLLNHTTDQFLIFFVALIWQIFISPLTIGQYFFLSTLLYLFVKCVGILKSPPSSAKIPGRELSCLPAQIFRRQMTRRTPDGTGRRPDYGAADGVAVVIETGVPMYPLWRTLNSPLPQQLNKPPPPKLPAVPLGERRRCAGR